MNTRKYKLEVAAWRKWSKAMRRGEAIRAREAMRPRYHRALQWTTVKPR